MFILPGTTFIMTFIAYLSENYIELLGFLFGIVYVVLAIRENYWCWLFGMVNVAMYIVVFLQGKLYGMMSLQVIYLGMSVYGLIRWRGKTGDAGGRVQKIPTRTLLISLLSILFLTLLSVWILRFTDNSSPWMDGLITAMGLVATWMTARKYLENWLVWIVNDAICVGFYLYAGLYLTTVLYAIFLTMAVVGYIEWKRKMERVAA
jgi:nicotinamide mononucleotide transporter